MQGWRANGAPRRISARTRPGAFVLARSDHVEPATARFARSWWRFVALAGHNALKIGHPASNCAVVLQVSAGFLSMPPTFCLKGERVVEAESEVLLNAPLMWLWVTKKYHIAAHDRCRAAECWFLHAKLSTEARDAAVYVCQVWYDVYV